MGVEVGIADGAAVGEAVGVEVGSGVGSRVGAEVGSVLAQLHYDLRKMKEQIIELTKDVVNNDAVLKTTVEEEKWLRKPRY